MTIVIIICLSLVIIVGIICFTTYKIRDTKQIEKDLYDIRYDISEIKCDLNLYNRILDSFTEKSKEKKNE